ncbi:hypothetical protein ACFPRL_28300 [Pseudoclavibacter helvolus]
MSCRARHEAAGGDVHGRSRRSRTTGNRQAPQDSRPSRSVVRCGGPRARHGRPRGRAGGHSGNTGQWQSARQRTSK